MNIGATMSTEGFGAPFTALFQHVMHPELASYSGKYVGLVPLISTYGLLSEFKSPLSPGGKHIFEEIPEHILNAAAQGRCLLVFDASFEGDPLIERSYVELHAWLEARGIDKNNVLILNQNRVLGELYEARFGPGIKFAVYDAYVKKMLLIFAKPDPEFIGAVGFSHDEVRFRPSTAGEKTFLCLNGAPRSSRVVTAAGLFKAGLLDDAEWSMLGDVANKIGANYDDARTFRSSRALDWIEDSDIEALISQMPKFIAMESNSVGKIGNSNELALQINKGLYDAAFCSIVTETELSDGDVQRVTEKTLKPFVMGHPAVLIGNPKSLELMRSLGFQTLGEVVDESYDTITHGGHRFNKIVECVRQVQKLRRENDPVFMAKVEAVCSHNIEIARSGQALRAYEEHVEAPMAAKISEMLGQLPWGAGIRAKLPSGSQPA
jgi:hypothetical protein